MRLDMTEEERREDPFSRMRAQARHDVYERMAFLSATIWVLGTLVLFIVTVPYTSHPQREIAVAMTLPLIPAALPWTLYIAVSDAVARRRLARERAGMSIDGPGSRATDAP
jgi:hypothetical protein